MNREIIGEHFRVQQLLGSGGFGAVYKARDEALERDVALKVLSAVNSSDPTARARFEREAKTLSQLRHENIVSIFNFGIDADGQVFIAMQLLEGESLRHTIRKAGALEPTRAARIIKQVAEGVHYAHGNGVIHRDLKPDNIMLLGTPEPDSVKVLDFGLSAFSFGMQFDIQKLTQTGEIVGTATYMSPEMCLGGKANVASDVYALGCVLYECLAGEAPFLADDPVALLAKHIGSQPSPLPARVPADLGRIAFKAMNKEPQNRFHSMEEFAEAIQSFLAGRAVAISDAEVKHSAPYGSFKLPKWVVPALLGVCATVALVGYVAGRKPPPPVDDSAWKAQMERSEYALWHKFPEDTSDEYQRARSLARTDRQRYLSDLGLGKVSSIRGPIIEEVAVEMQQALKEAVDLATDPAEKNFARLVWGACAMFAYDHKTVMDALKDQPWVDAKPPAEDEEYNKKEGLVADWAKIAYATGVARTEPDGADKAINFLTTQRPRIASGLQINTAWYCELFRNMLHSKTTNETQKNGAKESLRHLYLEFPEPLVDYRYQLRLIRDELGDKEVERLYELRKARAKT